MPYFRPGTEVPLDARFNSKLPPEARAPWSGIYKCTCGFEIVAFAEDSKLPQRTGRHESEEWSCSGPVVWQLVALPIIKKFNFEK